MREPKQRVRTVFRTCIAIALGIAFAPLAGTKPALAQDSCVASAVEAEQKLHIPSGLLVAIALVESGQDGTPNPYAISVNGRSVVARSAQDAAKRLKDRQGRVLSNVYVGCMQLSVTHHRGQFSPLERIAEPRENVLYAGRLLVRLHGEEGNWRSAVARYNGGSMRHAQAYVCNVWRHLDQLDGKSAKLLESSKCEDTEPATIAPKTRRVFRNAQVAQLD